MNCAGCTGAGSCDNCHMLSLRRVMLPAVILSFALPFVANAQSNTDLQSQVQSLLQRVLQLQNMLGGSTPQAPVPQGASACPTPGRVLRLGMSGQDVSLLQGFLARDPSIYPEAQVTGYFGSLTQAAVQRWQARKGIVSSGSPETTGFGLVGPRTAAAIALECRGGGGGAPVGGFIEVTPTSGNAPLSVAVKATVNTVRSCSAAEYTLDWGDASAPHKLVVPAGACAQMVQQFVHKYIYGGQYLIKLSSGQHETRAFVTVSGPSAPKPGAVPEQKISAAPREGTAPLEVIFTGVVNGASKGWCEAGCSSTLEFGDGKTAQIPLPKSQTGANSFKVTHTYEKGGTFTAVLHQAKPEDDFPTVGSVRIVVGGGAPPPPEYTYGPITPSVTGLLSMRISFELPTSCTGFDLNWGDGTLHDKQSDGGKQCTAVPATKVVEHTFAREGTYKIVLRRGPKLEQTDSVSVVITK